MYTAQISSGSISSDNSIAAIVIFVNGLNLCGTTDTQNSLKCILDSTAARIRTNSHLNTARHHCRSVRCRRHTYNSCVAPRTETQLLNVTANPSGAIWIPTAAEPASSATRVDVHRVQFLAMPHSFLFDAARGHCCRAAIREWISLLFASERLGIWKFALWASVVLKSLCRSCLDYVFDTLLMYSSAALENLFVLSEEQEIHHERYFWSIQLSRVKTVETVKRNIDCHGRHYDNTTL